jgi:hypothetical protein
MHTKFHDNSSDKIAIQRKIKWAKIVYYILFSYFLFLDWKVDDKFHENSSDDNIRLLYLGK